MIHMNHAGTSWPKPAAVRTAVAEALSASPASWPETLAGEHAALCRAFGVEDPERMLLTPGGTSALAVAISDHPWERGDRILISGLEHHALHRPALLLESRGVEVGVVPMAVDGPLDLDGLRSELDRGKVRMVAVTAAANVTGDLLPVAEIARLARYAGALTLVDASQLVGWQSVDLRTLEVDLLAFAGHKALQGPWGVGGLYVAPGVSMATPRAACELPAGGGGGGCAPMPGYCDVGSVDRAAVAGLVAGIRWLSLPARADRLSHARRRVRFLEEALGDIPGVSLVAASGIADRLPTLALTMEGLSPGRLAGMLAERGILASGGLQCAPLAHETLGTLPDGVLRLSLGPCSTDEEVEVVAREMKRVAVDR